MVDKLKDLNISQKELAIGLGSALIGFAGGIILKRQVRNLFGKIGLRKSDASKPIWGAQHQKELPKGKHPIQLYSLGTPNGQKATILLEELGLKYDAWLISFGKKDQFGSGFISISPNNKIPAIVDYSENDQQGQRVYETGSILLHFAEKTGKLLPKDPKLRTECINLVFFQIGSAPFLGQLNHFNNYAPKGIWYDHDYALNRYKTETNRILLVLDSLLEEGDYLIGNEYTIADIAWYSWASLMYKNWSSQLHGEFNNLQRWLKLVGEREAVVKGLTINQPWVKGNPAEYHSED